MIRYFRKEYNFTQAELAKLSGVSRQSICEFEKNERCRIKKDTPLYRQVKKFISNYRLQNSSTHQTALALKTYNDNQKLLKAANQEYKPQDNVIKSVLPVKRKSLLARFVQWLIKQIGEIK